MIQYGYEASIHSQLEEKKKLQFKKKGFKEQQFKEDYTRYFNSIIILKLSYY